MAAMRLCSALKQGKPLTKQSLITEQNVLARRNKGQTVNKNSAEEEKKISEKNLTKTQEKVVKKDEKKVLTDNKKIEETSNFKDIAIPLQISQEVVISKQNLSDEGKQKITFENHSQEIPLVSEVAPDKKDAKSENKTLPEEQKQSSKIFPRLPSLPKVYKPLLSQIEEEISTPKTSSRDSAITVEDPSLISSGWLGSTSYYLYTIITRVSGKVLTVKRRFSDMD